jgi:alkanesulfonate monooxygenase SsuD/methylene tetrahydromethanopterin reductase-like flavin-dependent oxidoreductase (luciferase family)
MKCGFVFPGGDARTAAEHARLAEDAGWDGFFVWEPVWGFDAWVTLAAAAMLTSKIRLGTMLTPLSRMRPWKLASETVTVDHLSGGRVILSVGLGATDTGFEAFGEVTDRKQRAELLDEGLEILTGLWRGQPFSYTGKHYAVKPTDFFPPPPPVQQPRIPIWVVGAWKREKSLQRALRYDGLLPLVMKDGGGFRNTEPEDIRAMKAYIKTHRTATTPYDIVVEGVTPGNDLARSAEIVQDWEDAGATWWIEAMWNVQGDGNGLKAVRKRIEQGPPVKRRSSK